MPKIIKMSDADYFADPAISKSLLARMSCPAKVHTPYPESPAMFEGTVIHCAVLEPDEFDKRYVVFPKIDKRTKAGKEEYAALMDAADGKEELKAELYDTAMNIQKAVYGHSMASELLSGGKAEMAAFWEDERTGEPMKAKADYVGDDYIADLKTTRCASPGAFSKSCADFRYHWQAAHYMRGVEKERFHFIAVEKTLPYVVECYQLDEASIDLGRVQIDEALDKYRLCRDFDDWPGYTGEEVSHVIGLPSWAMQ